MPKSSPSPRTPVHAARQWMLDNLSIRQRLSLFYVTLLAVTLLLFSVIVFTVASTQLQISANDEIKSRAVYIANALQGAQVIPAQPAATPGASPSPTVAPSPTPSASPTPAASGTAGSGSPTVTPSPQPTVDPATSAKIQQQLKFKVPDALTHFDTPFEVLDANLHPQYVASPDVRLPIINADIESTLMTGVSTSYTADSGKSQFEVYVQPIHLTPASPATGTGGAAAASTAQSRITGVVLVAKPLDDLNNTTSTLSKLLFTGDLIALVFAALGGWLIAEGGLRPIANVTRAAAAIAKNAQGPGLGTRVRYRGPRDEVGELVTTFNEMLAALEQVAVAQRRFVADASHELRAPLTTIKGSLEFLRRVPDLPVEERTAVVEDAYAEAERMAALVSDLLLLARADAAAASGSYGLHEGWLDDQLRGRREPVEMDQLVMDIFRQGRAQLRARRKDLHLTVTNLEPITVLGDPGQLKQLALILLDNAIKYTPSGGKIRLSVTRNGDRAAFSIADNGIGIDPDDRQHIFERFYRADRARERDTHGSGLGLSIAKWIADAHKGEISVMSQPGQGSTFTLLLPAVRRVEERTGPTSQPIRVRRRRARPLGPQVPRATGAVSSLARLAKSVSRPKTARDVTGRAEQSVPSASGTRRSPTAQERRDRDGK